MKAAEKDQEQLNKVKEWYKTLSDDQVAMIKALITVVSNCPNWFDLPNVNNCDDCAVCWTSVFGME